MRRPSWLSHGTKRPGTRGPNLTTCRCSNFELHAFYAGDEFEGERPGVTGLGEQAIEHRVAVTGIVVEHDQPPHPRQPRKRNGMINGRMSPAHVLNILRHGVLRVVDQQVRPLGKVVARGPHGVKWKAWDAQRRFMV